MFQLRVLLVRIFYCIVCTMLTCLYTGMFHSPQPKLKYKPPKKLIFLLEFTYTDISLYSCLFIVFIAHFIQYFFEKKSKLYFFFDDVKEKSCIFRVKTYASLYKACGVDIFLSRRVNPRKMANCIFTTLYDNLIGPNYPVKCTNWKVVICNINLFRSIFYLIRQW